MPSIHGPFVWYDLMSSEPAAAERFYGEVLGWTARDSGAADVAYTLFESGGRPAAGLMQLPAEAQARGIPSCWTGYVGVDDVDAVTAAATGLGAQVLHAPSDIPNAGRFSLISDPQGAVIALFSVPERPALPVESGAVGFVGWRELTTSDWPAAFDFYSALFGWTKLQPFDMGPLGLYQIFATDGEVAAGGMMNKPEGAPPYWLYSFAVGAIDPAVERVQAAGGRVLNGPHAAPGGGWVARCLDPQGALFALMGTRAS